MRSSRGCDPIESHAGTVATELSLRKAMRSETYNEFTRCASHQGRFASHRSGHMYEVALLAMQPAVYIQEYRTGS